MKMENLKRVITLAREMGLKKMTIGIDGMSVILDIEKETKLSDSAMITDQVTKTLAVTNTTKGATPKSESIRNNVYSIFEQENRSLSAKEICKLYNETHVNPIRPMKVGALSYHLDAMAKERRIQFSDEELGVNKFKIGNSAPKFGK
jgi:hypothetical protein